MGNEITNPATPPTPVGQVPGQAAPANTPPAAGTTPPGQGQPNGANGGQKIEMDSKEVETLKRNAGRWEAHQKSVRDERRGNRSNRSAADYNIDGADPETLEALRARDTKLDELSLSNRTLAVKDKVRDLFESEEYKGISPILKKAIINKPLGFVKDGSESIEDAIADIQDYLDDELDALPSNGDQTTPTPGAAAPAETPGTHQVPPSGGSAPASPNDAPDSDIAGKSGPARSTAILGNLLKNRK